MKKIFLLAITLLFSLNVFAINYPVVRTSAPVDFTPHSYFENVSPLQNFTDVSAITQGFSPSDVKIRNLDGTDTVVFNCTSPMRGCAVQESRVSPDGTKLALSITFGTLVKENATYKLRAPIKSHIYIYNLADKSLVQVPNQPADGIARMPDWIDNTTLVLAANWGNTYPTRMQWNCHQGVYPVGHPLAGKIRAYNNGACASINQTDASMKSLQIWRMKIDGTEKQNLTPHESNAIRPVVLHNPKNKGRIAFSSYQGDKMDACFYQGAAGPGTCANRWWIMTMGPDGTSPTVWLGGHHSPTLDKQGGPGSQRQEEMMALRAVSEDATGRICVSNYYRGNHIFGGGSVFCATLQLGDAQVEGCSTEKCVSDTGSTVLGGRKRTNPGWAQFIPSDLQYIYSSGTGSDNQQGINTVTGKTFGIMGYPSLLANNNMMLTWGEGWCYNQQGDLPFNGKSASIGGEPLCDLQIVELLVPNVTDPLDPSQVKCLICDPAFHDFDAVEIRPRPVTHVQPPLDKTASCFIEVADLRNAELYPLINPMKWNRRSWDAIQGNTVKPQQMEVKDALGNVVSRSFHWNNVTALAAYGVQNQTTYYPNQKWKDSVNYTGYESVWKIGQQQIQDDGSVRMRVPCEQPMFLAAVDNQGKWITHEQWLRSLRAGETVTCVGCHDGHSNERRLEIGAEPQAVFAKTKAAALPPPPLLASHAIVSMEQVGPIIEKACSGCHEGFKNDPLLWSRVFADQGQVDFPWMKKMKSANGAAEAPATCLTQPWRCYDLPRPYWSGLTGRYARQSMLIWVMSGNRLDGYVNSDFADDQDYPEAFFDGVYKPHPAAPVTPQEIRTVVDYMQQGAPMKAVPGC